MLDPFTPNNYYNLIQLTDAINLLVNKFGLIRNSGLFKFKGVRTTKVAIEMKEGQINILQTMPRGAPPQEKGRTRRNMRYIEIPHIPLNDVILPEEYLNIRSFGTTNVRMALGEIYKERQEDARQDFALTEEFQMLGALKGVVYDKDGSVIIDLYDTFSTPSRHIAYFDLDNSNTDVSQVCRELLRRVDLTLRGETFTRYKALCGKTFFDKLIVHPSVKEFFLGHSAGVQRFHGDMRKNFDVGGIIFSEYLGYVPDSNGGMKKFIDDDEVIFIPMGTTNVFTSYYAPADFIETAGTVGRAYYSKIEPLKLNRGILMHHQSNPLHVVKRPDLLAEGRAGTA